MPVAVLSRKIAAKFRDALKKEKPSLFAEIPEGVWQREWVSFCKHYGHGYDAVLNYLSRYVFRTAISNGRILDMDDTHVVFRCKDHAGIRGERSDCPAWSFAAFSAARSAARFSQSPLLRTVAPVQARLVEPAGLLLMLEKPIDANRPVKIADLLEALSSHAEPDKDPYSGDDLEHPAPCCLHCGSARIRLVARYPRFGAT